MDIMSKWKHNKDVYKCKYFFAGKNNYFPNSQHESTGKEKSYILIIIEHILESLNDYQSS